MAPVRGALTISSIHFFEQVHPLQPARKRAGRGTIMKKVQRALVGVVLAVAAVFGASSPAHAATLSVILSITCNPTTPPQGEVVDFSVSNETGSSPLTFELRDNGVLVDTGVLGPHVYGGKDAILPLHAAGSSNTVTLAMGGVVVSTMTYTSEPACSSAPAPTAAAPTASVKDNGNGTVTVTVVNTADGTAASATYTVTVNGKAYTVTAADGKSGSVTTSQLADGTYPVTVKGNDGTSTSTSVTVKNPPAPTAVRVEYTGRTATTVTVTLPDINAGESGVAVKGYVDGRELTSVDGANATYTWVTSFTGVPEGAFTLTVKVWVDGVLRTTFVQAVPATTTDPGNGVASHPVWCNTKSGKIQQGNAANNPNLVKVGDIADIGGKWDRAAAEAAFGTKCASLVTPPVDNGGGNGGNTGGSNNNGGNTGSSNGGNNGDNTGSALISGSTDDSTTTVSPVVTPTNGDNGVFVGQSSSGIALVVALFVAAGYLVIRFRKVLSIGRR